MAVVNFAISPIAVKSATALALALALSACASSGKTLHADGKKADYEKEIGVFTNPGAEPQGDMDAIAAAAYWGTRFERNPKDLSAAVAYSAALRKIGSVEEAVKVMTRVANANEDNAEVNLEAGKGLVEAGRAFEAVRFLERASTLNPKDWRALSAYGVALDQIGEHELARTKYDLAILQAPNSPQIMNNKGLSFAMSGDLDRAKATLRAAASVRGSDARVRQNLALVLALKGEMREAERLARSDLPPQVADQNIDYFRSLMSQPAYWQEYAADNVETPDFDAPAKAAPQPAAALPQPKPAVAAAPASAPAKPAAAPVKTSADVKKD
jgi:Flp pilus assembly protein TadD